MKEFVDFLGTQSPYDALPAADLERLAASVEVEFFPDGTVIVPDGAPPMQHMYLVRAGAVEVLDRGRVVDLLTDGDTFGHISVLSGLAPPYSVRAVEDTLCYLLPDPRTVLAAPERLTFAPYGMGFAQRRLTGDGGLLDHGAQPVARYLRPLVWVDANATVGETAQAIGEARQSYALVRMGDELGIVTDGDFRALIASGRGDASTPIRDVASRPVATISDRLTVTQTFLAMLDAGVHHLVVADDKGEPVGVVRVVDMASVELRDPILIRSAVDHAVSADELAAAGLLLGPTAVEMYDAGVPAARLSALLSTVRDAIVRRAIELVAPDAELGVECSWLVLGSTGRGEPFPSSDLDTAVMWQGERSAEDGIDEVVRAAADQLLVALDRSGLARCAMGANATNPLFSRPATRWRQRVHEWVAEPSGAGTSLLSSFLIDSRPVTGLALGRSVADEMLATARSRGFLAGLLRLAMLNKPPTGFVRDFVVGHSGEHRGELDLKDGGLVPVAGIARLVAVASGDVRGTTTERLRRGADRGLIGLDDAETLIGAYEHVFDLVMTREIQALRSGDAPSRYVDPRDLDTLTRRHLRESFRAIAATQARMDSEWSARLT